MKFNIPPFILDLLKSRRFWAGVAALAISTGKTYAPGIFSVFTEDQITAVVYAIGAWIVGESLRSSSQKAPTP